MESNQSEDNNVLLDPTCFAKAKSTNFTKFISKKNKGKDISQDIILNFKYDDFEPISNKYQPSYKKQHGKIYYDDVDILDQNRYKFLLNIEELGGGNTNTKSKENPTKYSNKNSSNIKWDDIHTIKYYSVDIYTCPICLDKNLICPQITRCGHIFCWPCLISYYDFWTISAVAKKIPKCPLCQEQINLNNTKFCEILNCVNYLSCLDEGSDTGYHALERQTPNKEKIHFSTNSSYQTHFITFNLIMKDKKAPVLYNTFYDPYLEYYKSHMKMENLFNFIPLETDEAFSFSRIFSTTPEMILKKYTKIQQELEDALKEELESISDERKIKSLDKCLYEISVKIKYVSDFMQNQSEEKESEKNEDDVTMNSSQNIWIREKSNSNNENQSTIDDDSYKNDKIDYNNYIYFYQEQYADIYYLHPLDSSILVTEFGSEEHLPTEITVRK